MMLYVFIHSLTGRVFKILPLKEDSDAGVNTHLGEYIGSVVRDAVGALSTFPQLQTSEEYISVVNTLQYLNEQGVSHAVCKQEVFKMLKLLNTIEKRLGGDSNE